MLNKLGDFIRRENMIQPGDRVICALSGGADSVALLWGLYLLREKLGFTLEAAHFNHGLRGEESQRDAAFAEGLCSQFDIPFHLGAGEVKKGPKGLEAAAREARYAFFRSLGGKIATAHTADDNAETVLLHLVRGTGLKGLGGIAPVSGDLIRPMLTVTRDEVLAFLQEYHLPYVQDSSNDTDAFLRNRLRHHVMPLLRQENPRIAENLSAMAQGLRQDAACLEELTQGVKTLEVARLRQLQSPLRTRILEQFLKENGLREPTRQHIALAEKLVFSENPSAQATFSGGMTVSRCYGVLTAEGQLPALETQELTCPGTVELPALGLRIHCTPAQELCNTKDVFTLDVQGPIFLRSRQTGDEMKTFGGTKSLKKLFVDAKIPKLHRMQVPVLEDRQGILAVFGFGADQNRLAGSLPAVQIRFEKTDQSQEGLLCTQIWKKSC